MVYVPLSRELVWNAGRRRIQRGVPHSVEEDREHQADKAADHDILPVVSVIINSGDSHHCGTHEGRQKEEDFPAMTVPIK